MINVIVEIGEFGELHSVKASGHANNGSVGNDVVCSAVSILLRTVVLTLFDKENGLKTNLNVQDRGELFFEVLEYTSENLARLQYAASFLKKGLESVELEAPKSVNLVVECMYA